MPTSPSMTVRNLLVEVLRDEFSTAELSDVRHGKLHPSIQGPIAAVYPVEEGEGRRVIDQDTLVAVQVYLKWSERVDPRATTDPTTIEAYAERFREAVYTATHPYAGSAGVWDLRVLRVVYEDDPTGQRTRFTAFVQAMGQNFAETTA
jgi:hypothetical protein